MLRRRRNVAVMLAVFAAGIVSLAQTGIDPALQGNWMVVGSEHQGKPTSALNGGTMTVTKTRFEIHTAAGNLLTGELRLDRKKRPAQMDFLHDSGLHWEAIYQVRGDDLKLNYVAAGGKDKRPSSFATSPESEASVVILKRQNK